MKIHASGEDNLEAVLMLQKEKGDIGQEVAKKIYERHQFFTEQLIAAGVDRETAEQDACRMEHVISQEYFEHPKNAYKTKE